MDFFKPKKKPGLSLSALHIDDSQWVRIPVSVLLRRHFGMKVHEASSGAEGLMLAERERPDVIILDVVMPQMDGFDTLIKLKENTRTKAIPVLMCTARDLVREVNMAVRLGAVGYLIKPIEEDILIEKIKNILTTMGKWGNAVPVLNKPYPIPPDELVDLVIPKKAEHSCPFCQMPLSFLEQYNAWYCYLCRKYADLNS